MNSKYSYHPIYTSKFVKFSILKDKISVKKDFLMWSLYLPTILLPSFHERVCNKVRVDYTYLEGRLKYMINQHVSKLDHFSS
jgi:hypothetical protein